MVLTLDEQGIIDPDMPQAGGRILKAHDNKLASRGQLRGGIGQVNDCILKQEMDLAFQGDRDGNPADLLAGGG